MNKQDLKIILDKKASLELQEALKNMFKKMLKPSL